MLLPIPTLDHVVINTLDRLDADHARGEAAIRELEHALLAYEVLGDHRRQAFVESMERYIDAYLSHLEAEGRAPKTMVKYRYDLDRFAALADARRVRDFARGGG